MCDPPYAEHARLLKTDDIDDYIRYGGMLQAGELAFRDADARRDDASFRDDESTRRYIDTAIAQNIQRSLRCFQHGSRFFSLKPLFEAGELTNVINRIVADGPLPGRRRRSFKRHLLSQRERLPEGVVYIRVRDP